MQETQGKNSAKERTVDLARLVQVLWKRVWLLILVTVLVGAAAFAGSKLFGTPRYSSNFTAYVNNRQSTMEGQTITNSGDITASRNLTYLYEEIIVSRSVLIDAAEACQLKVSYKQLRSMVETTVSEMAAIITVTVEAEDPQVAQQLATAIADAAPVHVERIVDGSSMRIVDAPVLPTAPVASGSVRTAILAAAVAFAVCAIIVILLDMVRDHVQTARELEERHGLTVVGVIPDMMQADKFTYGTYATAAKSPRRK